MCYLKNYLFISLAYIFIHEHKCALPSNMTILLSFDAGCPASSALIGTICQATLTIMIPVNIPTNFHVEFFSPNNSQSLILGRPIITYGSNYNIDSTKFQFINMISDFNDSRVYIINLLLTLKYSK